MADNSAAKRPQWYPVEGTSETKLHLHNTLTETKMPFIPQEGKQVKWYICGPTVYDSSHMGHARTYVAFDVIRRVMEDYFGYEIFCVMNVTDVDDKIILKARRNFLFDRFVALNKPLAEVIELAEKATNIMDEKFKKKIENMDAKLKQAKADNNSRVVTEMAEALDVERFKHSRVESFRTALAAAKAAPPMDEVTTTLLAACRDPLSEWLDAEEGDTVTDQSIFRAHAAKYEKEYFDDMKALGVKLPDVITRVTEFMPQVIAFVDGIVANGFAYKTDEGSVYFDTQAFVKGSDSQAAHNYGKLKPLAVGNASLAEEGEGALSTNLGTKKHPNDFALWKASKPGEPSWGSPWGGGRPGWHIECSAMAGDVLGKTLDIHCGGIDLCFPHHDNELAQAEAFYGHQQWVNYFIHTGHLYISDRKMSKSLKNFFTIREVLGVLTARQMRLMFLMYNWHDRMNYGDDALGEVLQKEKLFREFFATAKALIREEEAVIDQVPQGWTAEDRALNEAIQLRVRTVDERLRDNVDTPGAIQALSDLVGDVNTYVMKNSTYKALLIQKACDFATRIFRCFGLDCDSEFAFAPRPFPPAESRLAPVLDAMMVFRDTVRQAAKDKAGAEVFTAAADTFRTAVAALPATHSAGPSVWSADHVAAEGKEFADKVAKLAGEGAAPNLYLDLCDAIRNERLQDLGIKIEDKPKVRTALERPSSWKLDDPATLKLEREEKAKAEAANRIKKIENKLATLRKELKNWQSRSAAPETLLKSSDFSAWDDAGFPTTMADGKPVSDSKRKALEKAVKKQAADFEKYKKEEEKKPGFLQTMAADEAKLVADIEALGGGSAAGAGGN